MKRFTIDATDGEIGQAVDFYFDEERWTVRYMVVDAGAWFSATTLLISPAAVFSIDWRGGYINTSLTRQEVKNSPIIDSRAPLSRQTEIAYHEYYRYSYYWVGPNLWGAVATPAELRTDGGNDIAAAALKYASQDNYVRSAREVSGYQVTTEDGDVGEIEDFIIDDETWAIRYLIVATGQWWPGKKVMLSPQWITHVPWSDRRVYVDLAMEDIKNSPEYDELALIDRAYELRLYNYYGRSRYWND